MVGLPPVPLCLHPQLVQGAQAEPSPLPAGLRVWLGGQAGPKPSESVQRLQEHAFMAPARPQERLCCALRGECEPAPSLPSTLGVRYLRRKRKPGRVTHALGKLTIC